MHFLSCYVLPIQQLVKRSPSGRSQGLYFEAMFPVAAPARSLRSGSSRSMRLKAHIPPLPHFVRHLPALPAYGGSALKRSRPHAVQGMAEPGGGER